MRNNNNYISKNSNSIFIILISLFIIVFIIVAYFMLSDSMFDSNRSITTVNGVSESVSECSSGEGGSGGEVYNLRDNIFSYDEARAACQAHGAKLASLDEMIQAYKKGANWCSYGWSEGQLALYPTQSNFWNELQKDPYKKYECGKPGVNGGFFENQNYKFGANCYGVKPKPKSDEIEKDRNLKLNSRDILVDQYKEGLDKIKISPFDNSSDKKWNMFN
jgi:hypothetical protein